MLRPRQDGKPLLAWSGQAIAALTRSIDCKARVKWAAEPHTQI